MRVLEFTSVSKIYSPEAKAVQGVTFRIEGGDFVALSGPSGSGKTSILNLAAGLDRPTSGQIRLLGHDLAELSPARLSLLRRRRVGFVFQAYNLLPVLTALENVEYPLALEGLGPRERRSAAVESLARVGLGAVGARYPSQLSGGQQQRVAIARALVTGPRLIFADEPTANLDSVSATSLLELFRDLNERRGITFLFSSHDPRVLQSARRVIEVADGKINGEVCSVPRQTEDRTASGLPLLRDLGILVGACEKPV